MAFSAQLSRPRTLPRGRGGSTVGDALSGAGRVAQAVGTAIGNQRQQTAREDADRAVSQFRENLALNDQEVQQFQNFQIARQQLISQADQLGATSQDQRRLFELAREFEDLEANEGFLSPGEIKARNRAALSSFVANNPQLAEVAKATFDNQQLNVNQLENGSTDLDRANEAIENLIKEQGFTRKQAEEQLVRQAQLTAAEQATELSQASFPAVKNTFDLEVQAAKGEAIAEVRQLLDNPSVDPAQFKQQAEQVINNRVLELQNKRVNLVRNRSFSKDQLNDLRGQVDDFRNFFTRENGGILTANDPARYLENHLEYSENTSTEAMLRLRDRMAVPEFVSVDMMEGLVGVAARVVSDLPQGAPRTLIRDRMAQIADSDDPAASTAQLALEFMGRDEATGLEGAFGMLFRPGSTPDPEGGDPAGGTAASLPNAAARGQGGQEVNEPSEGQNFFNSIISQLGLQALSTRQMSPESEATIGTLAAAKVGDYERFNDDKIVKKLRENEKFRDGFTSVIVNKAQKLKRKLSTPVASFPGAIGTQQTTGATGTGPGSTTQGFETVEIRFDLDDKGSPVKSSQPIRNNINLAKYVSLMENSIKPLLRTSGGQQRAKELIEAFKFENDFISFPEDKQESESE